MNPYEFERDYAHRIPTANVEPIIGEMVEIKFILRGIERLLADAHGRPLPEREEVDLHEADVIEERAEEARRRHAD